MGCELCGKDAKLSKSIVENTIMNVCQDCIKYGEAINVEAPTKELKNKVSEEIKERIEFIHPDCGKNVKSAREKKGLTQEKLAKSIAEKESLIQKIENGFDPTIKVARKLEQFLGIKIIINEFVKKKVNEEKKEIVKKEDKEINFSDSGLTIGDLLKLKK